MRTKNAPTKDWAQRTNAGLALLPLACPALFFSSEPLLLLPESQALQTISGIQAWQQWKSFIGLQTSAPSLPKKSETLLLE